MIPEILKDKEILKALNSVDKHFQKTVYESDRRIAQAQRDDTRGKMLEQEIEFLDRLLHIPFFECGLQIKERHQALLSQLGVENEPTN